MRDARDFLPEELSAFVEERLGAPRFRAEQIFRWIHARNAASFAEMTDVPPASAHRSRTIALASAKAHAPAWPCGLAHPDGNARTPEPRSWRTRRRVSRARFRRPGRQGMRAGTARG